MLVLSTLLPAAAVAAELASQAATLSADTPHGMVLYLKHCGECHGRQAWGDGLREIPALAGQRESYLVAQLAHFIDGDRPGSELHGPAMHDALQPPDVKRAQAVRDLGAWLSRAPPDREPEQGAGQALAAGQRAYAKSCAGCHGVNGEGSDAPVVPALAGQHYSYLLGCAASPPVILRTLPVFPRRSSGQQGSSKRWRITPRGSPSAGRAGSDYRMSGANA